MRAFVLGTVIGTCLLSSCNTTVGECWVDGQESGSTGAGGQIITPGQGALGDVPPKPQDASDPSPPDCNIVPGTPCEEKCLKTYETNAIDCAKIESESQRRTCQESAYTAYRACLTQCARKTPLKVCAHDSPKGEELRELASCTGDLFVPRRLAHWSAHTAPLAVEGEDRPNPGRPLASAVYRITEHGKRLLEEGLESLTEAPSLPVAGTDAYASSSPWVVLENGSLARA